VDQATASRSSPAASSSNPAKAPAEDIAGLREALFSEVRNLKLSDEGIATGIGSALSARIDALVAAVESGRRDADQLEIALAYSRAESDALRYAISDAEAAAARAVVECEQLRSEASKLGAESRLLKKQLSALEQQNAASIPADLADSQLSAAKAEAKGLRKELELASATRAGLERQVEQLRAMALKAEVGASEASYEARQAQAAMMKMEGQLMAMKDKCEAAERILQADRRGPDHHPDTGGLTAELHATVEAWRSLYTHTEDEARDLASAADRSHAKDAEVVRSLQEQLGETKLALERVRASLEAKDAELKRVADALHASQSRVASLEADARSHADAVASLQSELKGAPSQRVVSDLRTRLEEALNEVATRHKAAARLSDELAAARERERKVVAQLDKKSKECVELTTLLSAWERMRKASKETHTSALSQSRGGPPSTLTELSRAQPRPLPGAPLMLIGSGNGLAVTDENALRTAPKAREQGNGERKGLSTLHPNVDQI